MLPVEEAKPVDDTFEGEFSEPTSTANLVFGEIQSIIDKFSVLLSQLQFDKAREVIETERNRVPDSQSVINRIWTILANSLAHLALNESVYYSLSFFMSKFSFRKENQLKMSYFQIKTELARCIELLDSDLVSNENATNLKEILKSLMIYLEARIELINFYTSLQNRSHENIAEDCLSSLEVIGPLSNLPFSQIVQKEILTLLYGFKAQKLIVSCSMLDALLIMKNLRELLDDWFKELESSAAVKPLQTSIFRFGKTSRPNTKLPLLNWLSSFYQTLLAKFSLYFHDVLVVFGPNSDVNITFTTGTPNFLQHFHGFIKKNTPTIVCIIANRIEHDEPFYGFGYHKYLERFSSEYCKPTTGINEKYPVLYYSPFDKKLFEGLQPSITSFVQDAYLSDGRMKYVYDKNKEQTFFCANIEKNLYLVVVFGRRLQEREPAVVSFYNDMLAGLRFGKLFQDLKCVSKN